MPWKINERADPSLYFVFGPHHILIYVPLPLPSLLAFLFCCDNPAPMLTFKLCIWIFKQHFRQLTDCSGHLDVISGVCLAELYQQ